MAQKESSRAGLAERATVQIVTPEAAVYHVTGWYWYQGSPAYLYQEQGRWTIRGYDFERKEEWRRADFDLSALSPCRT